MNKKQMSLNALEITAIVIASVVLFILLVWALAYWWTWTKANRINPEQTRVKIDPKEYSGKWYEIARYPQWFERGCTDTTATYTVKGDTLLVKNSCTTEDGKKEANGVAYPTSHDGVYAVSFFPGIYGNYTVVKKEDNISIVSNPDKDSLWILSRNKKISAAKTKELLSWLHKHNYDIERLEFDHTSHEVSKK
jgi:apolipoprotein D and lipocalin family protein